MKFWKHTTLACPSYFFARVIEKFLQVHSKLQSPVDSMFDRVLSNRNRSSELKSRRKTSAGKLIPVPEARTCTRVR